VDNNKRESPDTTPEIGSTTILDLPEIDLDTKPTPVARIKIGDHRYDVISTLDVEMGTLQAMLADEKTARKAGWLEQVKLARRQIKLVVPALAEEDLDRLTARQIVRLSAEVIGILQPKSESKE
jgi:hypothetical protein